MFLRVCARSHISVSVEREYLRHIRDFVWRFKLCRRKGKELCDKVGINED